MQQMMCVYYPGGGGGALEWAGGGQAGGERQQVTIVRAVHLGDGGHLLLMVNIFCSGFSLRIQESLSPTAPN
jgi:hypothetical protein